MDIAVGSYDGLSAKVVNKNKETESKCYQLVGSLCETIDLLKLKDKQATLNNFLDSVTNFTVNENKKIDVCEKQALKLRSRGNGGDDIEKEVLQVDQPHH